MVAPTPRFPWWLRAIDTVGDRACKIGLGRSLLDLPTMLATAANAEGTTTSATAGLAMATEVSSVVAVACRAGALLVAHALTPRRRAPRRLPCSDGDGV